MVDTRFSVSVQIMTSLAYHQGELMSSEGFADILKSNPTFIRKLIAKLVQAGLVESFRGKGGGIKLGRSPEDITLKDIYVASLENKPLISTHQKPVNKNCEVSCNMNSILCEVIGGMEKTTLQFLGKQKLSDLVKKIKA